MLHDASLTACRKGTATYEHRSLHKCYNPVKIMLHLAGFNYNHSQPRGKKKGTFLGVGEGVFVISPQESQVENHTMKRTALVILLAISVGAGAVAQGPRLMFDLSHGQFLDKFTEPGFYDYVIPGYREILDRHGIEFVPNEAEITASSLQGIDVLLILSPLAREYQKPFTQGEKAAIVDYISQGGSVLLFIDEEEYRVILDEYGANDITRPFGIEVGEDILSVPGNCGAVSFENDIFGGRREVPYSGGRRLRGGIPASVCMEEGWLHASYVEVDGGGKLFVAGETMVALLMGLPDGDRNVHNMMETRWWGKDSRLYMEELIVWAAQK